MRIISGSAGSRKIAVPGSVARPSADRLREALFSILGNRVAGARVLDLFAGSGALGLEALSRGAASCEFVDASRESYTVVRKNLTALGLGSGRAVQQDAVRFLNGVAEARYDLVFADPPYHKRPTDTDHIEKLLGHDGLARTLTAGGLLVLEDPPQNRRGDVNGWQLLDQRRYGGCGILFYQRER